MNEIENAFGFNEKPVEKQPDELGDNNAEKIISCFAYVMLVLGCLFSLIYGGSLFDRHSTLVQGGVIMVGGITYSIICWALLMVIANISNNIRQIKQELKKQNLKAKD